MTAPAAASAPSSPPSQIPVLLLKTPSTTTDPYATYFHNHPPFHPIFIPVLHHTPNPSALTHLTSLLTSGAISSSPPPPTPTPTSTPAPPNRYGALIFTSPRAVSSFALALPTPPPKTLTLHPPILYAIGPATSSALRTLLPTTPISGASTGTASSLARHILSHYPYPSSSSPRAPILFLAAAAHRDVLPRTLSSPSLPARERIRVDELAVYSSGEVGSFAGDFAGAVARTGEEGVGGARWVVVFSAVGGEGMLRGLGWGEGREGEGRGGERDDREGGEGRMRKTFVASIGPTTRDYLRREFGFEVDVCAEEPSPEGVGRGIERFMRERGMW